MNDQEREHHKIRITFAKPAVVSDFQRFFWALSFATLDETLFEDGSLDKAFAETRGEDFSWDRPGQQHTLSSSCMFKASLHLLHSNSWESSIQSTLQDDAVPPYRSYQTTKASSWSYYRQYDSIIVIKRHLENCLNFWGFKNWDVSTTTHSSSFLLLAQGPGCLAKGSSRDIVACSEGWALGAGALPRSISWVCQ